jgi:hypothetical protein
MTSSFARLFLPQAVLDEWSVGEMILLNGDELTLIPSGWRYRLRPAIHVQKCASGTDGRGIVGRVRLEENLKKEGAEVYQGSLVWGDDAYEGTPGFLAERLDIAPASPGTRKDEEEGQKDVEVLTRFLLDKL